MPVVTVEPGTTTAAKWGEPITLTPAGGLLGIDVAAFSPTGGTVDLLAGASATGLEVLSWTTTSVSARLPQSAPAGPPFQIQVRDGSPVPWAPVPILLEDMIDVDPPLPPISIPVPTLLVLFRLTNFDDYQDPYNGACTIVPLQGNATEALIGFDDDPDGLSQQLNTVLAPIGEAVNPATSEPAYWANFFTGYERLTRQVPLQKSIRVFLPNIENLKNVRYFTQKFAGLIDEWKADIYAEDTTSSLILIGPTGAKATLFNYREFNEDGGVLEVEITDESGLGAAIIPDLHRGDPQSEIPSSCRIKDRGASQWGDMIGSVKLEAPATVLDPTNRTIIPL